MFALAVKITNECGHCDLMAHCSTPGCLYIVCRLRCGSSRWPFWTSVSGGEGFQSSKSFCVNNMNLKMATRYVPSWALDRCFVWFSMSSQAIIRTYIVSSGVLFRWWIRDRSESDGTEKVCVGHRRHNVCWCSTSLNGWIGIRIRSLDTADGIGGQVRKYKYEVPHHSRYTRIEWARTV